MALFGRVRAEDLARDGERATGRLVGIAVGTGSGGARVDSYAVEVLATPIFLAGLQQRLRPDVVRLGMPLVVRHRDGRALLDWPGGGPPDGWVPLDDPPAAGITDATLGLAEARRGVEVTLTLVRAWVSDGAPGQARQLHLDLTVRRPGTPPYPVQLAAVTVPHYATHLCEEGRILPGWVTLDRVVIDWPAAAMADPGVRRPPSAVLALLAGRSMGAPRLVAPTAVAPGPAVAAGAGSSGEASPIGAAVAAEHTPVAGVDFARWVAVEAGLIRDRVPPGEHDHYAQQYGVAAGVWAGAVATWRGRIMSDWRLGAAFGEAIAAALSARTPTSSGPFGTGVGLGSAPAGAGRVAGTGSDGWSTVHAVLTRSRVGSGRRLPWVLGLWLTIAGVLAMIVGGVVLAGNQAAQVLAAADRSQVPDPLSFQAQEARYTVILLPSPLGRGVPGDAVAGLACDVVRADGTTARLRGSRQGVSVETSVGATVGSFDAVAGPTTVTCDFVVGGDSAGYYVAVAEQRPGVRATGVGALAGGGLALGLGVVLIVAAVRGRASSRVEAALEPGRPNAQ